MNGKAVAVVGLLAVAAVFGGGYYLFGSDLLGSTPTGNAVKEAFELTTGSSMEVLKVEDQGSLNRVVLTDGSNLFNSYITDDGQYIVANPVSVENYTRTLQARKDFLTCLSDDGAVLYAILANDQQLQAQTQAAQAQIQVLGGPTYLNQILQGPGTDGFPTQQVVANGVVWELNGELNPGIKTVPQLEDATSCTFNAEQ